MTKKPCPECNGSGRVTVHEPHPVLVGALGTIDCPVCCGSGSIADPPPTGIYFYVRGLLLGMGRSRKRDGSYPRRESKGL